MCPASCPAAPEEEPGPPARAPRPRPARLGRPPRAPYLCRRPASLRRGRRWPRGHGGRLASRAEPCESLRHRPGPSTSIPGLSSAPCERAKSRGRLRSAPFHTCSPGRSRSPGRAPGQASPPAPALMAAGSGRARAGCAPRGAAGRVTCPAPPPGRNSPGLCNSPAGAGPAARSPAVPRPHAGSRVAPSPGHPRGFNLLPASRRPGPRGAAPGSDGRSCSHLRSRRLACSHLLGLSSARVTTPASSCDITRQGVCGHRRRPLSRPCHLEQEQRRWHAARISCFACPGAAPCGPGSPLFIPTPVLAQAS